MILASEIIADSRGHDCGFRYWNVQAKRMLQATGFVASADLVKLGTMLVENYLSSKWLDTEWKHDLHELLGRMKASIQKSDLDGCYLTKSQYKKISIGLKGDGDAFGIVRNNLLFYNPTMKRALETTALELPAIQEFFGSFPSEPTVEDLDCTKIVLDHFSEGLVAVRCDAQRKYTSEEGPNDQSISFWDKLEPQLSQLSHLERFETTDLVVTEALALRLLELPNLSVLRVVAFSPGVAERLDFGERLVAAALAKESLRVIAVPYLSDELVELVGAEIAAHHRRAANATEEQRNSRGNARRAGGAQAENASRK